MEGNGGAGPAITTIIVACHTGERRACARVDVDLGVVEGVRAGGKRDGLAIALEAVPDTGGLHGGEAVERFDVIRGFRRVADDRLSAGDGQGGGAGVVRWCLCQDRGSQA